MRLKDNYISTNSVVCSNYMNQIQFFTKEFVSTSENERELLKNVLLIQIMHFQAHLL